MKHAAFRLITLILLASPVRAEPPAETPARTRFAAGGFTFGFEGEGRFTAARVDAIEVLRADPEDADRVPAQRFGEHRLLFAPSARWESRGIVRKVGLTSEIEISDGVLMGNFEGREGLAHASRPRDGVDSPSLDRIRLRRLYGSLVIPPVALRVGRQRSEWGLGMLANAGETELDALRFGAPRYGDVVDRATLYFWPLMLHRGAARPEALLVTLGGDRVVRDALADRDRDDEAWQALGTVSWHGDGWEAGAYYLYRRQDNALKDRTRVHAVDLFGRVEARLGDLRLRAGAELAMLAGSTEMMRSPTVPDAADVFGLGAMLEGRVDWRWLNAALEAGYASGDSDPFDDRFGAFSFHADHEVGLVMFEEFGGAVSAVQAANVSDPTFAQAPPRGFDQLPSDGAVSNAVYLFPRLGVRPLEFLDLLGGFLVAWGARPLVDPFWSGVHGASIGPFGAPAARALGWEVDAAVRLRMSQGPVRVFGILEGGWFDPGAAYADPKGEEPAPVSLVQARLQVLW
jgi:hypothetical protein